MTEAQMLGAALRQLRETYRLLAEIEPLTETIEPRPPVRHHKERIATLLAAADPRWEKGA